MPVRIPRVPRVFQYSSSVVRVSDHVQEVIEYCSFQCYISCMQTMRQGLLTAYFKKKNFISYLAVSVVVFICWWVCVWKIDRAMLAKEWLVQLGERKPILRTKITAINGRMLQGIEKHISRFGLNRHICARLAKLPMECQLRTGNSFY